MRKVLWLVPLTFLFFFPKSVIAADAFNVDPIVVDHGRRGDPPPLWNRSISERIYEDWAPSTKLSSKVTIKGGFAQDGRIYDVAITQSSGDAQVDADCLQAVLGATTPVRFPNSASGVLQPGEWSFDGNTHAQMDSSKIFEELDQSKSKKVLIFRIPLDVLKRYPGLFTKDELLNTQNLFAIKNDDPQFAPQKFSGALSSRAFYEILNFYADWQCSFADEPAICKGLKAKFEQYGKTCPTNLFRE